MIGRYWSSAGPQKTLYIPYPTIHSGANQITIVEMEKLSKDCITTANYCKINLVDKPLPLK